jgi:hypothetical protein
MSRRTATLLAIAALASPLAGAAAAGPATRVLAPDGVVFAVTQGAYGELFPAGAEALPGDPVLAITIIHPDGASERLLVPDTAGPAEEELASLVLGPGGETLHVLWQSSAAGSRLRLASLGAEGWGAVVDVSRAVRVVRGSPRAAVTRDRTELPAAGEEAPARFQRSVLHVVWLEEVGGAVIYAPLVIEDGAYIGDHALYALDRLAAGGGEPALAGSSPLAGPVALAPGVEAGGDAGAAVAAFTDPESGLLVSVELRMVSGELSDLGNRLREGLLEMTARLEPGSPNSLRELAAGAAARVIEAGDRLRPALVQLLAGEIEGYVLATGSDWAFQPETMADRTRGELLALGAAFDHAPVQRIHDDARAHLINVGHRSEAAPLPSHDLRLRVTAERPAPVLPEGVAGSIFLSGDGEHALVAWEREGVVFFRESDADAESGWGPVSSLGITTGEDPSPITELLRDRVRAR